MSRLTCILLLNEAFGAVRVALLFFYFKGH
jgi:hypothetical protein